MKNRHLSTLLTFTVLVYIIPLEGKKFLPAVFDRLFVQWCFMFITAILLAGGLFFSMRNVFSSDGRNHDKGCLAFSSLGFVALFSFLTAFYCWLAVSFSTFSHIATDLAPPKDALPKLLTALQTAKPAGVKPNAAIYIYRKYGVIAEYKTTDGTYARYVPNDDDNKAWLSTQADNKQLEDIETRFRGMTAQLPYVSITYAAAFLLTFWTGILWTLYRRKPPEKTLQLDQS